MNVRPTARYYDHLAGRLREFAAARIVTSLARRPQTVCVVLRGRVPNLLHPREEVTRMTSLNEDVTDQTPSPGMMSPALFKRQIKVPLFGGLKPTKAVGPSGNAFNLSEDPTAKTMPETVVEGS
jgi:hypothetical protein